eukprot:ANDGO_05725.mRNA.1 mitochondrial Probable tRNA N6-adenosine threonylcarbamoyltransferase
MKDLIVGVETSCDDTCVAVMSMESGDVLYESRVSQEHLNERFAGVKPDAAAKEHSRVLDSILVEALRRSSIGTAYNGNGNVTDDRTTVSGYHGDSESGREGASSVSVLDSALANQSLFSVLRERVAAVAYTRGPGLAMCLAVGASSSRTLASRLQVPLFPVHHLAAHLLVPRLFSRSIAFPFLGLLVSGGHCLVAMSRSPAKHEVLAETMDDALGEAFDKTARLLMLPHPHNGQTLEREALKATDPEKFLSRMPLPLRNTPATKAFSFAGLKTSMLRLVLELSGQKQKDHIRLSQVAASALSIEDRRNLAAAFQTVATKHVVRQVGSVMDGIPFSTTRQLIVSGGVASNQFLRSSLEALCEDRGWKVDFPPPPVCTDNAVMVCWAARDMKKEMAWTGWDGQVADARFAAGKGIQPRWFVEDWASFKDL